LSITDQHYLLPIYHAREKFTDIQSLLRAVFNEDIVTSFATLHAYIASKLQTILIPDTPTFNHSLDQHTNDTVVVIFSAGNGDGMIREYMQKHTLR
jgi:hypothetical protein